MEVRNPRPRWDRAYNDQVKVFGMLLPTGLIRSLLRQQCPGILRFKVKVLVCVLYSTKSGQPMYLTTFGTKSTRPLQQ